MAPESLLMQQLWENGVRLSDESTSRGVGWRPSLTTNDEWFDLVSHPCDAAIKSLNEGLQGAFRLLKYGGSGYMAYPEGVWQLLPLPQPFLYCFFHLVVQSHISYGNSVYS